jgi:hypothetical protein
MAECEAVFYQFLPIELNIHLRDNPKTQHILLLPCDGFLSWVEMEKVRKKLLMTEIRLWDEVEK